MQLLHDDAHLIAVSKPSGLAVHRGWAKEATYALTEARALAGQRVYPVHRLDRGTSGVLIFARSPEVAAALQPAFAGEGSDRATKVYLALVRGHAPEERLIDYAVRKGEERGPHVPRLPAQTWVRRLGTWERYSLVEARPRTGRLHQIRRHLHHISHPIIGDTRYGKGEHNRYFRERFELHRLALHAARLSLDHPVTGERLHLVAPLEGALEATLAAIGLLDAARSATVA